MMMMDISGVSPDLCLHIFCIAVFITLSLIYVFSNNNNDNNSELKTFVYIPDDDDDEISNNTLDDDDRGSRNGNNNINQIITITRTIRDCCRVCGNSANSRCSRCKSIRYCSRDCQIQHWRAGHKLECKEDSSRTSCNERRASGYMDTICSKYQQSRKDEALVEEKGPSERNLVKELKSVEECPICISKIRLSKLRRPSVSCDTCKHKFHFSCISKWFSISKNSICPLCGCKFKPGGVLQLTAAKKS
ncbi:hypothetical protein MKX01_025900 [Papaver californicum]|nr:hypothetical protein MKX01_025900 [Papaver californicum]